MKAGKNVRKENGTTINIGSLNIKRALFQKVQHDIGGMSYEETYTDGWGFSDMHGLSE